MKFQNICCSEGLELTKVKYIYCWDTLRNSLNIDFRINNERQDCKIGTVCGEGLPVGREVNGDKDEGIGLMDFIHIKEME
jgi:hypothetical protein